MNARDPRPLPDETEGEGRQMSPFSALGRRGLIQGTAATVLGSVAVPYGSRAEGTIPQPLATNLVVASRGHWNGLECLAVELTDDEQKLRLRQGQAGGNRPSIVTIRPDFADGVIEATIGAELTGKGTPDDRGFAGLSFHIGEDFQSHETVYLRMTNGRLNVPPPPPPRIDRAIQYVADPGFHFADSRARFPGGYEKGADIALGRWNRLRLEIQGAHLRALVDGAEVLEVSDLRYPGRRGPVGLFVGDGSRGLFTDFSVLAA
jgi:hypothetical protein